MAMKQTVQGNGIIEGDFGPIRVASKPAPSTSSTAELPRAFEWPCVQAAGGLSVNATPGVPTVEDGARHREEEPRG
jgi:hypothetical protein